MLPLVPSNEHRYVNHFFIGHDREMIVYRKSGGDENLEHLYGDKFIIETLRDTTFKIGPDSFFQVG